MSANVLAVPGQRRPSEPAHATAVRAVLDGSRDPRFVLQPIVDIRAGRVVGFEALARFGTRIHTPPGRWFQAAARLRQSAELEARLIGCARQLRPALPRGRFLAVNVSPDLLATPVVAAAFRDAGDLTGIVVELTEYTEFGGSPVLQEQLRELRSRGAHLALDDVGSGWAGLRQVVELRPDIVKLDRSLVTGADRDEVKLALVEMMLRLCSRLGSHLLVEGVETFDELEAFARLGVPLAQGWVFGKPALSPPAIDDDLSVRMKFLAGLTRHVDKLASIVDVTVPSASADTSQAPGPTAGDALVLVDPNQHPVAVLVRVGADIQRTVATTALASEAKAQALLRGLTRPLADRFSPLVCIDRAGRYAGIIRIDALAKAAAATSELTTVKLPG